MTKTITNSQLIGTQGEAIVSERANAMGFMFSRYGPLEAGIDGFLEIRDPEKGTVTGQLVAVQVKTIAQGSYTAENESGFEYVMRESDVRYWMGCNLPVIVVLVHLERRTAYWKSVEEGVGSGNRRIRIDRRKDVFDASAREKIADICVAKASLGVWFPPLKTPEKGHLNLLEIVFPKKIYLAVSPFKNGRNALHELLEYEDRPPDDWVIRSGQFMSFRDPRDGPLSNIVDVGTVEEFDTDEVMFPENEADEYTIIDLLRRTLTAQLDGILAYSRSQRTFYFPARSGTIERAYVYRSLKQTTSARVVKKYAREDKIKFVRHHAFEPRFWRTDDQWFLSITPTFFFTWDGFRPDRFAASRLSGKKQREYQGALMGQFIMWCHLLVGDGDIGDGTLFDLTPDVSRFLEFRVVPPIALRQGVPDDLWRANEPAVPESTGQKTLAI